MNDHIVLVEFHPIELIKLMGKRICLTGIPPDAEQVRTWYDPERDAVFLLLRHSSFPIANPFCLPLSIPLNLTTYTEASA